MHNLAGYEYEYVPGEAPRALLLLHGTGGNESQMLSLGRELDPEAHLVSIRGTVSENGMLRYFKRLAEGVFDRKDLAKKSEELAAFIEGVKKEHSLEHVIGVGYSNGANMLLHVICTHPSLLTGAVLLRPMSGALPDSTAPLGGLPVHIGAGEQDSMIPSGDAKKLDSILRSAGATTSLRITPNGHSLGEDDIAHAREWLMSVD